MEDVPIHYGGLVRTFNYFTLNQTIQSSKHTLKWFSIFRLESVFLKRRKIPLQSCCHRGEEEKSTLPYA